MKKIKCPNCQDEISFLTFAKAPTPWHIKCPNCKSKLKVGKYAGIAFSLALIIGATIGFTCAASDIPLKYFIPIVLLIAIVVEYIYFVLVGALKLDLKLKEKSKK